MKSLHLVLTGLLVVSFASATGCGVRDTFELPPTEAEKPKDIGTITVSVIDHDSKAVAGATVTLKDAKGAPVGGEVETDKDGKATFKKVPVGTGYTIGAENGGVLGSQGGLGIDGEAPLLVNIMLIPVNGSKGTIGGAVNDGLTGNPLDGATVSILGTQNTVQTQADGSYVLKDVPVGTPTVVAIMKGFRESRQNVPLKGGKLERAEFKVFPIGDGARMGHTLVASYQALVEVDKFGNRLWNAARGAYQIHPMANGNMLVAGTGGVSEITPGNLTAWSYKPLIFGRLKNPQGAFRAASGNVFIADTDNNRILEVSPGHQVQRTIKINLNHPTSVERIEATRTTLISDTGNHRVIEVGDDGRLLWSVGDGTTGLLNRPTYSTRLGNGNTLITDTGNHRVMEVNSRQQLVWMYGGKGERATCYLPNSATRLPNGNTLIADTGNDRVIEVNGKGESVWQLPAVEQPLFAERL